MILRLTPCVAALAGMLLFHSASRAQTTTTTGIQFTETAPITVTLAAGGKVSVTLGIQNQADSAIGIRNPRFYFVGTPAPTATVTPPTATLEAGAVAALTLELVAPRGAVVRGSGYLSVQTGVGVITQTLSIAPPAPAAAPVDKWTTATTMHCWKWVPGCWKPSLPFTVDTTVRDTLLRMTSEKSHDGMATVRVAGKEAATRRLKVTGLDGPGIYAGTLRVAGGTVALTVHARHWAGWLLLTLVAGVLMGLWFTHYTSVRRTLWDFRARCGELYERLERLAPAGPLTPDVASARLHVARAERAVASLRGAAFVSLDGQPGYTAALADVAALEAAATAWPTLEPKVAALTVAIADAEVAFRDSAQPPSPDGLRRDEPRIMAWARALAAPRAVPVEAAPELVTSLDGAVTGLNLVRRLQQAAETAQGWSRALRAAITTPQEVQHLDAADQTLSEAWWELWNSNDPAALTARETEADLASVEKQLSQLNHRLPDAGRAAGDAMVVELTAAREERVRTAGAAAAAEDGAEVRAGGPPRSWMDRLARRFGPRFWRALISGWDGAFLLLALVLAVLSGFQKFYYENDFFGKPEDYVAAILWGFTVKTVLDVFAAGVGKFFGTRSGAPTTPKPDAAPAS